MQVIELLGGKHCPPEPQLFGVEIEVEGVRDTNWIGDTRWRMVADGSLRDHGAEFITPPVGYRDVLTMLRELYAGAEEYRYKTSVRTGIHIHMDMRWRTMEQVSAICALYAALEPALFLHCGPEREEGIYCVPWYRSTDDARLLAEEHTKTTPIQAAAQLRATCKYSALYLEPLTRFGTIEFRGAPTFGSFGEMRQWLNVVRRVVRLGHWFGTPDRVVAACNEDVARVLRVVTGSEDGLSLLEQCDSLGVASLLIRIKRVATNWEMPDEPALDNTRMYHQTAGYRGRSHSIGRYAILVEQDENIFSEDD